MHKIIIAAILVSTVTVNAGVNAYFTPGVWVGPGGASYKASAYADSGFQLGLGNFDYEFTVNYRNWYHRFSPFNMLNLDNYFIITVNKNDPVEVFVAPMIGFGFGWNSDINDPYFDPEKINNIGVGGKCGVAVNYAEGRGKVELYFDYRGGIVLGEYSGNYFAYTRFGVDGYMPISNTVKLKLSVGAIGDNFYLYEGMTSDYHHTSPYLMVGPDIYF